MSDDSSATDDVSPADSLTDPERLRDSADVPFTEETAVHDDRDHCNNDIAGRAVVGITNDAGEVLLAVHKEESVAMLPHHAVEPDEDFVAVGRETAEITTGLSFEIDGVEIVRDIDHVVEGEEEPHATTYGVVFHASLAGDPEREDVESPGHDENDHWDAEWFDAVPETTPPGDGLVEEDIRLFVD